VYANIFLQTAAAFLARECRRRGLRKTWPRVSVLACVSSYSRVLLVAAVTRSIHAADVRERGDGDSDGNSVSDSGSDSGSGSGSSGSGCDSVGENSGRFLVK